MKAGLLDKIKTRGYWRVNFRPNSKQKIPDLEHCKQLIEKSQVRLRGWYYPHLPWIKDENQGILPCADYLEAWDDLGYNKEFWRIYISGQFLLYRALREDWLEEHGLNDLAKTIKPSSSLWIIGSVIYEVTEAFEFLSRLIQNGLYVDGVSVHISLQNTLSRRLIADENRLPFYTQRTTGASKIVFEDNFSKDQLLTDAIGASNKCISKIFDSFGWNPLKDQITVDQDKLLSRKL